MRHDRPLIDRSRPSHEWPLDPPRLVTDGHVEVVADLREHERRSGAWTEDFETFVRRAFERPDVPAYDGWEPLEETRTRVVRAVASILDTHRTGHVVLVGHGTAWTLVGSALSGDAPDLGRWTRLAMPDVLEYPSAQGVGDMLGA